MTTTTATSPKRAKLSPVWLAYFGEVTSILVLLTLGQFLIQLVLLGQYDTSRTATLLHQQELSSQKLLRNALLLFTPDTRSRQEAAREITSDLPVWENGHRVLDGLVFGRLPSSQQATIRQHYQAMDRGIHDLLLDSKRGYPPRTHARLQSDQAALSAVFFNEIANIKALDAVYTQINARSDALNIFARKVEISLYVLALGCILLGYLLVVRPARRRERAQEALITRLEETQKDTPTPI